MIANGLQLLGMAALSISSKLHDLHPVELEQVSNFIDRSRIGYEVVQEMEAQILAVIRYQIHVPTTRQFLRIYLRACGFDTNKKLAALSRFYIDLALLTHIHSQFKPSIIAISAILLSLHKMKASSSSKLPY